MASQGPDTASASPAQAESMPITRFLHVESFTQPHNTARRVATPPNPAQCIVPTPPNEPSEELLERALKAVKDEMDMIYREPPRPEDMRVDAVYEGCLRFQRSIEGNLSGDNLSHHRRRVLELVDGLRWRFRIQERFYDAMTRLVAQDLLDPNALSSGIDWDEASNDVETLVAFLEAFEMPRECCDMAKGQLRGSFHAPVRWMARIVLRAAGDVDAVVAFMVTDRVLGAFDRDYADAVFVHGEEIQLGVEQGKVNALMLPAAFAFWLPRNFDGGAESQWEHRYQSAVKAYETLFGENAWGDVEEIGDMSAWQRPNDSR